MKIDIDHVTKLANLNLSPKDKRTLGSQLEDILEYFNQLSKVDTKKTDPIGQITGLANITREDTAAPSLSQDEALANAPRTHNGFIEVDTIFEDQ